MANLSLDGNCVGKSKKDENDNDPAMLKNNASGAPNKGSTWTTVEKDALYYKMDHKKQGYAYIFNHQTFKDKANNDRNGTDVDEKRLARCLRNLNFKVHSFKDLKKQEICHQISIAAKLDHSHCNCFFLAVFSHGDNDILHAYDQAYDPYEVLFDQFTADVCPTLAGKPKLFLLQSCQGSKTDPGVVLTQKPYKTETDGHNSGPEETYRIPVYADFLIMYATSRGHYAFRNTTQGSYYVKVFCDELENLAYKEFFLNILTIIQQRVALEFVSNAKDPDYNDKKQVPYYKCSLIRLLQFRDILEEQESNKWESLALPYFPFEGNLNGR